MLNSVVAKTAPHFSSNATFLSKVLASAPNGARQFSVAFNVRSKFEDAYEKRMQTLKATPKKAYILFFSFTNH